MTSAPAALLIRDDSTFLLWSCQLMLPGESSLNVDMI